MLAKSLVRNRQYVTKMHHMKANLQAVSLKITVRTPPLSALRSAANASTHDQEAQVMILVSVTDMSAASCHIVGLCLCQFVATCLMDVSRVPLSADIEIHRSDGQSNGRRNQGMLTAAQLGKSCCVVENMFLELVLLYIETSPMAPRLRNVVLPEKLVSPT